MSSQNSCVSISMRSTPTNSYNSTLGAKYVDGFDIPRGFPGTPNIPTAIEVSNELFKVEHQNKGTGDLSVLFMTFGQFLDHDITLATHPECEIKR